MFFCLFQRRIRDWNRAGSQNATLVNLCDVKFSDTSLMLGNQSVQEDFQAIRYRTLFICITTQLTRRNNSYSP